MPLSDQENLCVQFTCDYLSSSIGGYWVIESYPDDLHPSEPTPEVIVSNGSVSAAIEVKRLTGDSMSQVYIESLLANQKYLVPSCGGYYTLNPPVDFRLPMAIPLRKLVKKEIERVAPSLNYGESGVIRVPRYGYIALISESGPSFIHCVHGGGPFSELLSPIAERVNGKFMLVDEGLQHSFFTDEGRTAFHDAIVAACERRLEGDSSTFSWYEEWELTKLKEDDKEEEDEKGGVWIITVTEARNMMESVAECVYTVLTNALRKFVKRWADLHILALEKSTYAPGQFVTESIASLETDELKDVDLILFIDDGKVIQCYPIVG
jgi:hypothetical protein